MHIQKKAGDEQREPPGAAIVFMKMRAPVRNLISVLPCILWSIFSLTAYPNYAIALEKDAAPSGFDKCAAIADTQARLSCIKNLIGDSAASPSQIPKAGGWRLIARQHPNDASSWTSIMRIPDTGRSDENLAGLMLRCKEQNHTELHIAVVSPYSPRAAITVSLQIGSRQFSFPAKIGPGGTTVILPSEAVGALMGPVLQNAELKVEIGSAVGKTVGIVPLNGLDAAYAEMTTACRLAR